MHHLASLLVALLALTACGTVNPDPEETAAIGQAELDRHADSPLVAPIDIDGLAPAHSEITPARANDDQSELFGTLGRTPTTYLYTFLPADGVDAEALVGAAVEQLVSRGFEVSEETEGTLVRLRTESMGDLISVEMRLEGTGVVRQTVTIANS